MKSSRKYLNFCLIFLLFLTAGTLLHACQLSDESDKQISTQTIEETFKKRPDSTKIILPTIHLSPTPTPTATEMSPTTTPTEIPCLETTGNISEVAFYSDVLGEDIKANVYLPPCYDTHQKDGYPLLVMLHGQNGVHDQWINLGLTTLADEWITMERIEPLVIVMPFERLYLSNSYNSKFDLAIVEDLLPQLLEQYNLRQGWEYRAIGGISRGGNWAVRIGFTYPDAFGRVGAHSFTTFAGDMNRVQEWKQSFSAYQPALWFDIGDVDQYRKYSEPFVLDLQKNQYPLKYTVNSGGHTVEYWMTHLPEYLNWYTQNW